MRVPYRLLTAIALLLFATEGLAAYTADGERKSFDISRADSAPVIDGRLDDPMWRYITGFVLVIY